MSKYRDQMVICISLSRMIFGDKSKYNFRDGEIKEKQLYVFERFYRVAGATEQTYPGLGIGLYISREIIKRQGGSIWVKSEKGKGSTFGFTLPVADEI